MNNTPERDFKNSPDPHRRAGEDAERQMAHYLHRAFGNVTDVLLLNHLRLVDPAQPEHNGAPGVCQIDHLVLHRWGAFIIESKSVADEVAVRDDGAGGDEWTRRFRGLDQGFASPIRQARRQAELLRGFLERHREALLSRTAVGLRTLAKALAGSDHRSFRSMPIQIIVAISDSGRIHRVNDWKEPTKPFRTFVSKADLVPEKILGELRQHQSAARPLTGFKGEYGLWEMKQEEFTAVADFLKEQLTPRSVELARPLAARTAPRGPEPAPAQPPPHAAPPTPTQRARVGAVACRSCDGVTLTARWGRYGYYWTCADCSKNAPMPTICSACGAEGARGRTVRIRKNGRDYDRCCEACGIEQRIWTDP